MTILFKNGLLTPREHVFSINLSAVRKATNAIPRPGVEGRGGKEQLSSFEFASEEAAI